jgi:hypothetical protein
MENRRLCHLIFILVCELLQEPCIDGLMHGDLLGSEHSDCLRSGAGLFAFEARGGGTGAAMMVLSNSD